MSAGKPNWQKLHAQNRLPEDARRYVPILGEVDKAQAKIKKLEEQLNDAREKVEKLQGSTTDDVTIETQQEVEKNEDVSEEFVCSECNFEAKSKAGLLSHSRKHK